MPSSVDGFCVDPKHIRDVWPHVEPLLRQAMARTGLGSFEELENDILFGDGLLWVCWNGQAFIGAVTTSLVRTDGGLVCIITAFGSSDMSRCLPMLYKIEQFAKAEGCKRVRLYGRKGWNRVLQDYQMTNVILDKELS